MATLSQLQLKLKADLTKMKLHQNAKKRLVEEGGQAVNRLKPAALR